MNSNEKIKKYTLTVTEEQLRLIAGCVEDCHRFISGQPALYNTTFCLDNEIEIRNALQKLHPLITPELSNGGTYGWSGKACPNKTQRLFIAKTYPIYREIYHKLANTINSVYASETLTCDDGGNLPKINVCE